eukprot:CAMPEP_0197834624 /NCGR_PEP_ID=MMETSP1437-20131217/23118_1 /TAXON_ID=49252 ORGANISM="Eucampia antarctica, Strain CCMP1452" /NCGR_SAMPLE_ID=MMETSP1437 /ASSEMBLY_ACC=CAM_ASM_001096 /LENGTH=480 /DNA_ID=CAMNT_0043439459 /DNA_START=75 /DNA_END=1517 /DNA_ORIENTATION=+
MVAVRRSSARFRKPEKKEEDSPSDQGLEEIEKMLEDENDTDDGDSLVEMENEGAESSSSGDEDSDSDESEEEIEEMEEKEGDGETNDVLVNETDAAESDVGVEEDNMIGFEGEKCTFDLRNLLAINSHQVNTSALYKTKIKTAGKCTIDMTKGLNYANEGHLFDLATDGCAQLISGLWELETEKTDAGPLAILPGNFEIKIPRELPPPVPKQETKWEKFAKEKRIPLNQEKRSRKVWDESTQSWMYRTGFEKANNSNKEWPIMEVGGNDDPFEDPWERVRDAKRTKVDKNTENRMRNQEKAGFLTKGTTTRTMKAQKEVRKLGREGGNKDKKIPAGVPVDLRSNKVSGNVQSKNRGMELTKLALTATQRSTASLGKFDKMREGEPQRKKAMAGLERRKFVSATDNKVVQSEANKSMKVLGNVLKGGGKQKENAIRRGEFAQGETAYDYDYNDGLGASSFKKKKGRAGMGKMKKITKKRAK